MYNTALLKLQTGKGKNENKSHMNKREKEKEGKIIMKETIDHLHSQEPAEFLLQQQKASY